MSSSIGPDAAASPPAGQQPQRGTDAPIAQCPDSEIRNSSISRAVRISESKDTSVVIDKSGTFS
jgi:hypothetical protein